MNFTTHKSVALVTYGMLILSFIMIYGFEYLPQPRWSIIGLAIYVCFAFFTYRWHQSGMPIIGYMVFYSSWFFLAHILVSIYGYMATVPLESASRMIVYVSTAVLMSLATAATAFYHFKKHNISTSYLNTNFSLPDKFTLAFLLATMFFSAIIEYNESDPLAKLGTYALTPFAMSLFVLPVAWSFVKGYQNKSGTIAFTGSWIILYFAPMMVLFFASNTALNIADHPWNQADIQQFNLIGRPYRYALVFAFLAWLFYQNWKHRLHTAY